MTMRFLPRVLLTVVAAAVAVSASLAAQSAAPFKAPRTPWGDPDLQGIWNGNDLQGVPTTRAATVGTRMLLNDNERRQRVAQRDRTVETDNLDFDLEQSEQFEAMGAVGGPVSPPPHWLERSQNVSRQSSFMIEPANGRFPPRHPGPPTSERAERQKVAAGARAS